MKKGEVIVWDVAVIGGGPAGMMAAATAAEQGARVILLEKNKILGKKLRITGGGRCNVTNNKPDARTMLSMYKGRGKFLFSTFAQHGVLDTVSWFKTRGVTLKEENEGRLFPITDSAETVAETLVAALRTHGVTVLSSACVTAITKSAQGIFNLQYGNGLIQAKRCILATGGLSRPDTGSTGDGFTFAKELGHTITSTNLGLVPMVVKEPWVKKLSGITIPDCTVSIFVDGKRVQKQTGKLLFTHFGVSGPVILNLSKETGDHLQSGTVTLQLDLFPNQDSAAVRQQFQNAFQFHSNRTVRNAMATILPAALARALLQLAGIAEDTPCHSVTTADRKKIYTLSKQMPLTVTGLMGKHKAIISSGGVKLEEVNFKTMESRLIPGLYLIGDLLDIDRPSGGYSLQLCWSTGYVAGFHAGR